MTDHLGRGSAPATPTCIDCGAPPSAKRGLTRDRCRRCYDHHVSALKKAGAFESKTAGTRLERLLDKAAAGPGGCIIWTGRLTRGGYGHTKIGKRNRPAHRVAYELMVGPIPDGMQVDHTCHNRDTECPGGNRCLHRRCINPYHLQPVTGAENQRRSPHTIAGSNARRTDCPNGHQYDEANTGRRWNGGRQCRKCRRQALQRYSAKIGGVR